MFMYIYIYTSPYYSRVRVYSFPSSPAANSEVRSCLSSAEDKAQLCPLASKRLEVPWSY